MRCFGQWVSDVERNVIERVGALLRTVSAAVVMPRFAALRPHETEMKAANEPVTIADREAEVMLTRSLLALVPGSRVIGEEACSAAPALLDHLGEGTVWIVDPIDGTANFAAGRAPFAMMVALLRDGVLIASWIYDPLNDRMAVAEFGGGAWIDGERLRATPSLADPALWHGIVSRAFLPGEQMEMVDVLSAAVGRVDQTARCAGHEYPLVATGARDFILYWRTLVWDHAPGVLLLTEAGGCAIHLDGTIYTPAVARSGLLLAHDAAVANTLLALALGR